MTKTAKFLLLTIVLITWSPFTYSQNCSYGTMTLASQQTDGGCGPNSPFAQPVTITTSNTFTDTCYTTADAASNPGAQYYTVNSSVTGSGACEVFVQRTISCPPEMDNSVTQATGPDDYNRFYNQAYDTFVNFDSSGTAFCDKTGGFHQNFQQCAGQACSGGGGGPVGSSDCDPSTDYECLGSSIIIDVEAEGFHLTSPTSGITFDIKGNGHPVQLAWTDAQYHNAFLVLPGADGLVHNGGQLFGNFTTQPSSAHPNGFIALAQYDKPENGGNGDGIIDERDAVFSRLRLWIDENHDGISQPSELHQLSDFGVYSLALKYIDSPRTDQFGNQFRYKAQVDPGSQKDSRDQTSSGDPGRWIYDVFLVIK